MLTSREKSAIWGNLNPTLRVTVQKNLNFGNGACNSAGKLNIRRKFQKDYCHVFVSLWSCLLQIFINNEWVNSASGKTFPTINPVNCKKICDIQEGDKVRNHSLHNLSHVMRKPVYTIYANNKDADQPAHPHSLISAFVVRFLDSIIPLLAVSKMSSL